MRIRAYPIAGLLVLFGAATSRAQAPWTVTITLTANPLPIGTCHTVLLTVVDPKTKGTPVSPLRKYVSIADFDMNVQAAAVSKYESASIWSVCACQFATVGAPGTITATYPAKGLAEDSRVPGVAFKSEIPFTFAAAQSKYNAAGCDAVAASGAAVSGSVASGGAASGGAASGGAAGASAGGSASGGAAGAAGAAAGGTAAGSAAGAIAGGAAGAAGGGVAAGAAAGAASGGLTAGGAAAAGAAGAISGGAAAGGAAGSSSGGAAAGTAAGSTSGGASSGGTSTGGAAGAATGGAAAAGAAATPAPPPQNVRVLPGDSPLVEVLTWDRLSGITGYNVYITANAETGPWTLVTGKPLHAESFTDSATRRSGTGYRVTALYADGRQASTDVIYKGR